MNLIEQAVLPLKTQAIERAEKDAKNLITQVHSELEAAGWDLNVAAPYPETHGMNLIKWRMAYSKWNLFRLITAYEKPCRSMREPDIRKKDSKAEQKFVKEAKENAAFQYDQFVEKLVKKITADHSEIDKAELLGNHVWSWSMLTVSKTKINACPPVFVERWKTHQISNVSKYGKIFNQWPSRKIK